jgi:hypothetical protein
MIRTFTIVAAVVALLLPAGRYIDDALGTGVKSGYASSVSGAPASALASQTRPFNDGLALATRSGGEILPDFAKAKAGDGPDGIIAILIG